MTTLDTLRLLILVAMLAFLAGLLVYFKKHSQWQLSKLYLPCVLFWGLVYTFVFIPFTAPDEYAHYASAYRLSNQMMLREVTGTAYDEAGHVMMREEDTWELGTELSEENYEEVFGNARCRIGICYCFGTTSTGSSSRWSSWRRSQCAYD